jgi:site-specific recombinase XerC/DNA invertase Pin-like site-specific DNA recombinase
MHSHVRFNRGLVRQYHKWMKVMHYAGTTQTTYLKALHQYVGFMGQRSLARAKHTDIRLFIAQASENGATLGSVYRHLGILRQFYDFLNLGGVVDYVAPRFVRLRLPWHQRPRVLSEAQVRQLISATRTPRERALIEFFYSTGCRLNEVRHTKIEQIDFISRHARVRGKLGKIRLVLLAESAATAVRKYIGSRTTGYVFEADYPKQKGHFSPQANQWKSKWHYTRKRDNRSVQKTKVLGSTARMTYEEASRWGRFQDTDEPAHYEFICRSAGIPVHYCAETFTNDGTLPSLIMKALKRTMAGEFSRELGVKVLEGQKRLAREGFKQGGLAGYGLRRMLLTPARKPKQSLEVGERKSILSERVNLVLGSSSEVECVRAIFDMFVREKRSVADIARELNRRDIKNFSGRVWEYQGVNNILMHPKYAGFNVFNRTTRKLSTPTLKVPRSEWILKAVHVRTDCGFEYVFEGPKHFVDPHLPHHERAAS